MTYNKSRHAPPKASAMVEALRGLGYSTATALADILDNSIAANATRIDIEFAWKGADSYISILDNGVGMNEEDLDSAMRLGQRNPLDERSAFDLGRFGLGLKTASFSQCRRLTVTSKKTKNDVNTFRWDLDILAASKDDGWYLLEGPDIASEHLLAPILTHEHGTLVLWEKLDQIVTSGFKEQNYLDMIDKVEQHIAMVFHRFLSRTRFRIAININGRLVKPWDPFLIDHPSTWSSPLQPISDVSGTIKIQCHVLPHKDRLTEDENLLAAGPDGWTSQQGFYVYRNERLLVAGSWLGLGRGRSWTKEEAHRLARIRLDLPNSADADWKIDIRKSTARPPVSIREKITLLAEDTRDRARRVFAHRGNVGKISNFSSVKQAWRAEHFKGGMRYRIDLGHPAIALVLENSGGLNSQLLAMLRVIEETIPVQRIWLDTTEAKETPRTSFADERSAEVFSVLKILYKNMILLKNISPAIARQQLLLTEPFNNYPELVMSLSDEAEFLSGSK